MIQFHLHRALGRGIKTEVKKKYLDGSDDKWGIIGINENVAFAKEVRAVEKKILALFLCLASKKCF